MIGGDMARHRMRLRLEGGACGLTRIRLNHMIGSRVRGKSGVSAFVYKRTLATLNSEQ